MDYKQLINDLRNRLDAYKFFDEERLRLLKISIDLQIANRELSDLNSDNSEIFKASLYVQSARDNYDRMYCKYENSIIEIEKVSQDIKALLNYVNDLESEIIKLKSTL